MMVAGQTPLILALLGGFGLGLFFYGGLWLTVRALPHSSHPILLALGSFWGRTALVVAVVALTMAGYWLNAAVGLIGFALARLVLTRWLPAGRAAGKGSV